MSKPKFYRAQWQKGRKAIVLLFENDNLQSAKDHADHVALHRPDLFTGHKLVEVIRLHCSVAPEAMGFHHHEEK